MKGGGGGVGVGGEGKFKFAERRDTHQHEESTLTCTQRGCDYLDLYKQTMWKKKTYLILNHLCPACQFYHGPLHQPENPDIREKIPSFGNITYVSVLKLF